MRDIAPTVYLAHLAGSTAQSSLERLGTVDAPPLLISYAYAKEWERVRAQTPCREWVLDSGAFTARSMGITIRLEEFIDYALQRMADDPRLTEVFALDVIGDHKATMRNTEAMWARGIKAIPCFHEGSPWAALRDMMRFPKIALGGVARASTARKDEFAAQVFARAWPKQIHGFGYGAQRLVLKYPWHSVDASSWNNGIRYAQWWSMAARGSLKGGRFARVKNAGSLLHGEIEHFARVERAARSKWRSIWQSGALSC